MAGKAERTGHTRRTCAAVDEHGARLTEPAISEYGFKTATRKPSVAATVPARMHLNHPCDLLKLFLGVAARSA